MGGTSRRELFSKGIAIAGAAAASQMSFAAAPSEGEDAPTFDEPAADWTCHAPYGQPLFKISVAQWSLNQLFWDGKLDNRDFGVFVKKEFGLDGVEWVNSFFKDYAQDLSYLRDQKQRCDDAGVRTVLIMCDREGRLGDPDAAKRAEAVDNHKKWVNACKLLGGHSIRVNAASEGSYEEQQKLAADGLAKLTEFARGFGINVIVENHGGNSSNGQWLTGVMKRVAMPEVGTLPDFGNFTIDRGKDVQYDRYRGISELMRYAKAVSAKSWDFDENGNHPGFDFERIMRIVLAAGYHGYVGIEYEGKSHGKVEGVRLTLKLLEKIRAHHAAALA